MRGNYGIHKINPAKGTDHESVRIEVVEWLEVVGRLLYHLFSDAL